MLASDRRYGAQTPYLRAWREHRLLSQGELARRAHVHRGTVIAGEMGRHIRLTNIGKLARALRVERPSLTDGPEPPRGAPAQGGEA